MPLGPSGERVRIWREIRERHAAGQTKGQIAQELGITGRNVQYHINGHRPLADAVYELATSEPDGDEAADAGDDSANPAADLAEAAADNATAMAKLVAENEALRSENARLRGENDNLKSQSAAERQDAQAVIPHRKAA